MSKIKIHSIETLGALDGPGIRTVVFFSGCPMRCRYCHNPDTWSGGEERDAGELAEWCTHYKAYYGETGGVTLSGGEPLYQADGAAAFMRELKMRGIHTVLDTGGGVFCPEAYDLADLTIIDIKHPDPDEYKALTGVSQDNLLLSLAYLRGHAKRFWVRHVCVPGYTDTKQNILDVMSMSKNAEKIELLPYHTMGVGKWEKLGIEYPLKGVPPLDGKKLDELKKYLELPLR